MNDIEKGIPRPFQGAAREIFNLTDTFCAEHLDSEYADLCRKLVARLARKRPSPLVRGDLHIWAGAVIYTIGSINFLFDRSQPIHLSKEQISRLTGVPIGTLANKSKLIRDLLRLHPLHVEYCRRELLRDSPLAWMISMNGMVVDARTLPYDIQALAYEKGLIPYISDQEKAD